MNNRPLPELWIPMTPSLKIKGVTLIDYDGSEDDLSLGKPNDKAEEIAKLPNKPEPLLLKLNPQVLKRLHLPLSENQLMKGSKIKSTHY